MKLSYDLPDSKKVGSWSVTNPFDYRRAQASASMYERKGSVLEFPRMRATQVESPQDVARWISTPSLAIGNGAVDTR